MHICAVSPGGRSGVELIDVRVNICHSMHTPVAFLNCASKVGAPVTVHSVLWPVRICPHKMSHQFCHLRGGLCMDVRAVKYVFVQYEGGNQPMWAQSPVLKMVKALTVFSPTW